jgi:hypothetical protein
MKPNPSFEMAIMNVSGTPGNVRTDSARTVLNVLEVFSKGGPPYLYAYVIRSDPYPKILSAVLASMKKL